MSCLVLAFLAQAQAAEPSGNGSDLLVAVLGGSVGFLLGALARGMGVPSDVRTHDAAIAERDAALATWVADRDHDLRRTCASLRAPVPRHPGHEAALQTPEHSFWEAAQDEYAVAAREADRAIADAKGEALHEYRDEARRASLDVSSILAAEGWALRLYRRGTAQAEPHLTTLARATPVLDAWRKPSAMYTERQTWPDDATQRTLEGAIETMPVTGP